MTHPGRGFHLLRAACGVPAPSDGLPANTRNPWGSRCSLPARFRNRWRRFSRPWPDNTARRGVFRKSGRSFCQPMVQLPGNLVRHRKGAAPEFEPLSLVEAGRARKPQRINRFGFFSGHTCAHRGATSSKGRGAPERGRNYFKDSGSERFLGDFLLSKETSSCPDGGTGTAPSRIICFAVSFFP
jgi:hypothetical protein